MIRTDQEPTRRSRSNQSSTYLITGAIFGLLLGLIFSLGIAPLRYTDADVAKLDKASKDRYRILVAHAYLAEQDLDRAQARLMLLGSEGFQLDLAGQANTMQGEGLSPDWMALQKLYFDLTGRGTDPMMLDEETEPEEAEPPQEEEGNLNSEEPQAVAQAPTEVVADSASETEEMLESTAIPKETIPPKPTSTTAAALNKPFQLEERLIFCDPAQPQLLQVQVSDEEGLSLQGVPIHISWAGGSETFFTGLYGEVDDGYADFDMEEDVVYRIQVGLSDTFVDNLSPTPCVAEDGSEYYGGWWLAFQP